MTESIVDEPTSRKTRRAMLKLLAQGATAAAAAPALFGQPNPAFETKEVCVTTELSPDGLVRSARYMQGNIPVVLSLSQTSARTHRTQITSRNVPILTADGDFSRLGGNGRFGIATVRVQSQGVDWEITVDGSEIPISEGKRLPPDLRIPIHVRSGKNVATGIFDLATQKAQGLQGIPHIDALVAPVAIRTCQPFLPALQAVVGYASHHTPQFALALGIICIAVCTIAFAAALAICGAAAGAGPVGWVVCAEAMALAAAMCASAC